MILLVCYCQWPFEVLNKLRHHRNSFFFFFFLQIGSSALQNWRFHILPCYHVIMKSTDIFFRLQGILVCIIILWKFKWHFSRHIFITQFEIPSNYDPRCETRSVCQSVKQHKNNVTFATWYRKSENVAILFTNFRIFISLSVDNVNTSCYAWYEGRTGNQQSCSKITKALLYGKSIHTDSRSKFMRHIDELWQEWRVPRRAANSCTEFVYSQDKMIRWDTACLKERLDRLGPWRNDNVI